MQQRISKLRHLIVNNLPVILILILASFYRLYRIEDYMTFLGDEGRDVLVVYNILHGKLTLLGPTSSVGGFFLGPIYYYFMAPFLWLFNYNPVGPAIGVALIGIATVFLLYKIALTLFNKRIALIASFLYSISPLVVTYSRSSWNPNRPVCPSRPDRPPQTRPRIRPAHLDVEGAQSRRCELEAGRR